MSVRQCGVAPLLHDGVEKSDVADMAYFVELRFFAAAIIRRRSSAGSLANFWTEAMEQSHCWAMS